jgi:transcriptional regulator with XRE-family HTH domain
MDSAEELAKEEARWAAMGRHLRALREGRRWLQETLAKKADVSVATIRAVENHSSGRRQTPRTLEKLSRALQQPGDYLSIYLENAPLEDSNDGPKASAVPPQSPLDFIVASLDEIVVARLYEIVIPRLESVEVRVRALRDVICNTQFGVEADVNSCSSFPGPNTYRSESACDRPCS